MMRNVGTLAVVVLLGAASFIVYQHLSTPGKPPLDSFRREAARLVSEQVADKVGGDDAAIEGPVLFVPLAGDRGEDEVTYQLMQQMADAGRYNWIDLESLQAYLAEHELKMANIRNDPQVRLAAMQALAADGLMTGKIIRFPKPRGNKRTELVLSLSLRDKSDVQLFEQKYSASIQPALFSLSYWRAWVAAQSMWARFFGWMLTILLTPIVLMTAILKLIKRNSNTANLWLLLGLTAWSSFVAFFAIGLRLEGAFAGPALLLAVLAAAVYNYVAASAVDYFMK